MVLLRVMGLIEYEKIDLFHLDIGTEQTLAQNLCCTNYHHVLFEVLLPSLFTP